ncbi:hypothetical protein H0H92_000573 [Tricholoma furcatifolium]|nr:hypothetical protein H0H92_000573 [Tricholoma furcatifolium]
MAYQGRKFDNGDEEKYAVDTTPVSAAFEDVPSSNPGYVFDVRDFDHVQRRLKQRHVQMYVLLRRSLAFKPNSSLLGLQFVAYIPGNWGSHPSLQIAGTIGTGLFLGSGHALQGAGPLGALIAYMLVGSVAYSSLCSLAEMTTHAPISGTFPHYAARWVDPALGFAVGWNYFYSNAISTPSEISAAVILFLSLMINFHQTHHVPIYTAVIIFLMVTINIFGVRYFGEGDLSRSIIEILIIGLILAGLVIDLGGGPNHDRIGFRVKFPCYADLWTLPDESTLQFWDHPGAFAGVGLVSNVNTDRFLGILSVLIQAAFSYQGIEIVAV